MLDPVVKTRQLGAMLGGQVSKVKASAQCLA